MEKHHRARIATALQMMDSAIRTMQQVQNEFRKEEFSAQNAESGRSLSIAITHAETAKLWGNKASNGAEYNFTGSENAAG